MLPSIRNIILFCDRLMNVRTCSVSQLVGIDERIFRQSGREANGIRVYFKYRDFKTEQRRVLKNPPASYVRGNTEQAL